MTAPFASTARALALGLALACSGEPAETAETDTSDTGDTDDTGDTGDTEPFDGLPRDRWTFVEDPDFACADGSPAGLGVWPGRPDQLLLVVGGEGACVSGAIAGCTFHQWELLRGGWGDSQMRSLTGRMARVPTFDRERVDNPLRDATWVVLPYCTGDLHLGTRTFEHTFDEPLNETQHHGYFNLQTSLSAVKAELAEPEQLWVIGIEAGGYGAQMHADLFAGTWPDARLAILADNAPPVETSKWSSLRFTWDPPPPAGCDDCRDSMAAWFPHSRNAHPQARFGLIASTDHAWNLELFNLRDGTYPPAVHQALTLYNRPGAQTWLIDGEHRSLLLQQGDLVSTSGASLHAWVDAWATPGSGDWVER